MVASLLACLEERRPEYCIRHRNLIPGSRLPLSERKTSPNQSSWLRDYHMQIPYSGGAGHFTSVPYVAVLRGEVPASFIQGKYVLVGPTATGMADSSPHR
jgi:CHASE2 domain-containing sensor protein